MTHRIVLSLTLMLLGALIGACDRKAAPAGAAPAKPVDAGPLRIAVIPKGTTHDFWKSVHAGALRAARESGGVEVTFRGPDREDDREQQVSLVQNVVSAGYDAIVLAPLDDTALVEPVRQAMLAGIPVTIIDSGLKGQAGKDFVSFVATDNYKGGRLAGARLGELLGGKGRVLLLRYLEGSQSTAQREQGFIDAIGQFQGMELVDPHRYAGPTRASAQENAENLLASSEGITGVFCPNEPSTFGMLLALRARGLAGKVQFVGFDASDAAVEAMRKDEVHGLVLQDPIRMGYLGVKAAVDHARGATVPAVIDTGVLLVTRETLDTPRARELVAPDLKALLGGP